MEKKNWKVLNGKDMKEKLEKAIKRINRGADEKISLFSRDIFSIFFDRYLIDTF